MRGKAIATFAVSALLGASSAASLASETTTYTYDELGRLISTSMSGSVNNGVTAGACFDPAGNRANVSVSLAAGNSFSISNASANEGSLLKFTVSRVGDTTGSASVSYSTAPGTASSKFDYWSASGVLNFAPYESCKIVSVSTRSDTAYDPNETMFVNLSSPSAGMTVATSPGQGLIRDIIN